MTSGHGDRATREGVLASLTPRAEDLATRLRSQYLTPNGMNGIVGLPRPDRIILPGSSSSEVVARKECRRWVPEPEPKRVEPEHTMYSPVPPGKTKERRAPKATVLTSPQEQSVSDTAHLLLLVFPNQSIRTPESRIMLHFILPFTALAHNRFITIWCMRWKFALARNKAKRELKRGRKKIEKKRTKGLRKRREERMERMEVWEDVDGAE